MKKFIFLFSLVFICPDGARAESYRQAACTVSLLSNGLFAESRPESLFVSKLQTVDPDRGFSLCCDSFYRGAGNQPRDDLSIAYGVHDKKFWAKIFRNEANNNFTKIGASEVAIPGVQIMHMDHYYLMVSCAE